jgi:site-specific DNA recombinase
VHKGTSYPGEHTPIIDKGVWDQLHALITPNPQIRAKRPLGRTPAVLKGLIFGPTGLAMTPAHVRKKGKIYRYYVSTDVIRRGSSSCPIRRIPAAQIEDAVLSQIRKMLQSPEIIVATWRAARQSNKGLTERQVRDALYRFDELWSELFPAEQARIVQLLVDRVDLSAKGANITLRVDGLSSLLEELRDPSRQQKDAA